MSAFELLLVIYGAVLAVTALGVVYRMIVRPHHPRTAPFPVTRWSCW